QVTDGFLQIAHTLFPRAKEFVGTDQLPHQIIGCYNMALSPKVATSTNDSIVHPNSFPITVGGKKSIPFDQLMQQLDNQADQIKDDTFRDSLKVVAEGASQTINGIKMSLSASRQYIDGAQSIINRQTDEAFGTLNSHITDELLETIWYRQMGSLRGALEKFSEVSGINAYPSMWDALVSTKFEKFLQYVGLDPIISKLRAFGVMLKNSNIKLEFKMPMVNRNLDQSLFTKDLSEMRDDVNRGLEGIVRDLENQRYVLSQSTDTLIQDQTELAKYSRFAHQKMMSVINENELQKTNLVKELQRSGEQVVADLKRPEIQKELVDFVRENLSVDCHLNEKVFTLIKLGLWPSLQASGAAVSWATSNDGFVNTAFSLLSIERILIIQGLAMLMTRRVHKSQMQCVREGVRPLINKWFTKKQKLKAIKFMQDKLIRPLEGELSELSALQNKLPSIESGLSSLFQASR
ncbi:MAG: hypothetical protein ISR65_11090, partial [Bacteriovoracaceae bacterium]|nr:hypothetical protein [Bacteriovoracaceae bacterium]